MRELFSGLVPLGSLVLLGSVSFGQEWVRRYNGPVNSSDYAYAIAVADLGNVYVTGVIETIVNAGDCATIKYNSSGDSVWVRRYNGPGNGHDRYPVIALDSLGNVYVAGGSYGSSTGFDYATIKYNSAGDSVWVRRYNGPGNSNDVADAIAVDGGYVYVTGYSHGSGTSYDYATIKYSQVGVEERTPNTAHRGWRYIRIRVLGRLWLSMCCVKRRW